MANKSDLNEALKKLSAIVAWFDGQKEVDVEAGLEKVKEGAALVKTCRARLAEIENEFTEVEREIGA
ncbi:MAG: exodeoxyribonuclease VII small subunit [Candidatus Vogelbacteria bacterium]|nr:exodeoxyribonuclease VII small subunit [Candidatus Vogelbacteria bacterium]